MLDYPYAKYGARKLAGSFGFDGFLATAVLNRRKRACVCKEGLASKLASAIFSQYIDVFEILKQYGIYTIHEKRSKQEERSSPEMEHRAPICR